MSERQIPPPEIDTTVSNPARVYDYLLGGKDNFVVDREVAERMARPRPGGIEKYPPLQATDAGAPTGPGGESQ